MQRIIVGLSALAAATLLVTVQPAFAQNVKVTPLGSHDGEFCRRDRAMVFEDPDGTRIIYDVGRTVAGPDDPRLGKIARCDLHPRWNRDGRQVCIDSVHEDQRQMYLLDVSQITRPNR